MHSVGLRMGEFPLATFGAFDFQPEDFQSDSRYFGLNLSETYLIAHLRSKVDGRDIHVTRPIMLFTSGGFSLSGAGADGGVYQDARGAGFMRGGIYHREIDADGALHLNGWGALWGGESPLTVDVRVGKEFVWEDSGQMSLCGRLIGPGAKTYVPSRRGRQGTGVCHTGVFFEGEGTVLGEPVSGIMIIEQIFTEPGEVLSDSSIRKRFAGGWNGFATVFEDGTSHQGHIAYGAGPFRFANIIEGDRHIASEIVNIETELGDDGLGKRVEYTLANGEKWEFITTTTLMDMLKHARQAGSDVRLHKGYFQRVGENRKRRNWYSIQEWVPQRMVNNAPEAVEGDTPRGF